jgi:hypothetical protein
VTTEDRALKKLFKGKTRQPYLLIFPRPIHLLNLLFNIAQLGLKQNGIFIVKKLRKIMKLFQVFIFTLTNALGKTSIFTNKIGIKMK